jgi:hypothetical protein
MKRHLKTSTHFDTVCLYGEISICVPLGVLAGDTSVMVWTGGHEIAAHAHSACLPRKSRALADES